MNDTTDAPTRLEGDDLYIWARLIADIEHAQRALDRYGSSILARSGLDARHVRISNEGYFLSRDFGPRHEAVEASPNGTN